MSSVFSWCFRDLFVPVGLLCCFFVVWVCPFLPSCLSSFVCSSVWLFVGLCCVCLFRSFVCLSPHTHMYTHRMLVYHTDIWLVLVTLEHNSAGGSICLKSDMCYFTLFRIANLQCSASCMNIVWFEGEFVSVRDWWQGCALFCWRLFFRTKSRTHSPLHEFLTFLLARGIVLHPPPLMLRHLPATSLPSWIPSLAFSTGGG